MAKALAARGARLQVGFDEALDREAYFGAATRQACLAVVEEIGTPAINRADKKSLIASYVAADAEKKHWLPAPLSDWTKLKATSPERPRDGDGQKPLAQAMVEAIDADTAQRETKIRAVCDLKHGAPQFAEFLISHIRFENDLICKASDLREAYILAPGATTPLTAAAIGNALADLGVAKKRLKDGIYYKGIGLADAPIAIGEAA